VPFSTSGVIGAPLHAQVVWAVPPGLAPMGGLAHQYAAPDRISRRRSPYRSAHPLDYLRMLSVIRTAVLASLSDNRPLGWRSRKPPTSFFRFNESVAAQVHLDYWSRPSVHRVDIVCADGTIRWDYITEDFQVWDRGQGVLAAGEFPSVHDRNDLFLAEPATS